MNRKDFDKVRKMTYDDPLTDAQIRELTGADKDDIVDVETAAAMLGVTVKQMRLLKVPRVRINKRFLRYRLIDVRNFRDKNTF